ncbi:hypothetical protein DTO164E3_1863 [Paecilomyces variotii]|nr:hypothetical protein DTO164E3_1863 [Paecilomyces variotii]KAJ9208531.1 hypothetical protein DTO032I3_508 [Paecilomyces variotii]KAJ9282374.1 hypothetical protein DTO021D3_522 [Paecilomyces variotii]KAJ9340281.1 hypothetical protein DTO027B6_7225 [Paecilomyces variotii]KAJ9389718.1 hypothetical protein DTO032I4_2075 [Paecilomyces variotii]
MKPTTTTTTILLFPILALLSLSTSTSAKKTCTPSFDYCADDLIKSNGFTESDLKAVLNGTDLATDDLKDILFHCKNPGIVGHPKLCESGCTTGQPQGSHGC